MTTHAEVLDSYDPNTSISTDPWSSSDSRLETEDFYLVAEAELDFEQYAFSIIGVFRHAPSGLLFHASDSGCSCPSPWEAHRVADLAPLESYQAWLDLSAKLVGTSPAELDAREAETGRSVSEWERSETEEKYPLRVDSLERVRKVVEAQFNELKEIL